MSQHNCQKCGGSLLMNILETGVSGVCQPCGLIYTFAKGVSNSPEVPPGLKTVAGVVAIGLLFLGGLQLLGKAPKIKFF